jgi:hypothetical protein
MFRPSRSLQERRWVGGRHRYRCGADEPVAPPGEGLDEPGTLRGVPQRFPQPRDRGVQVVVEIDKYIGRPQPFPDLFAGDDFARTFQQKIQDLERLFPEPDLPPVSAQLPGS